MLTISLEKMTFYAGHGVYPEEAVIGQAFLVDASVSIEPPDQINDLDQTIDYEKLYEIINKEMNCAHKLLETVAQSCISQIKATFSQARTIEISISKLHPPMGGEIERSRIHIIKHFN